MPRAAYITIGRIQHIALCAAWRGLLIGGNHVYSRVYLWVCRVFSARCCNLRGGEIVNTFILVYMLTAGPPPIFDFLHQYGSMAECKREMAIQISENEDRRESLSCITVKQNNI